jgi:hypothetical protein
MFQKVTAGSRRVDGHSPQLRIIKARGRRLLNHLQQPFHPFGGRAVEFERPTPLAWPISGKYRLAGVREIFTVFRQRRFGRARRPAEDPGGLHGDEKDAFVRGISVPHGPFHFFEGWQTTHIEMLLPLRRDRYRFLSAEFEMTEPRYSPAQRLRRRQ